MVGGFLKAWGPLTYIWRHKSRASLWGPPYSAMVMRAILMERCTTHIQGRHLFFYAMILQKMVECIENKLPAIVPLKQIDFKLDCTCALNFSKDSPLDYNAYNHIFFRKSLMEVIQYLALPTDVVLMGHTCMNVWFPKACSLALPSPSFGNATLCCLSSIHASQTNDDVGQGRLSKFMPLTIFWSIFILSALQVQMAKAYNISSSTLI